MKELLEQIKQCLRFEIDDFRDIEQIDGVDDEFFITRYGKPTIKITIKIY